MITSDKYICRIQNKTFSGVEKYFRFYEDDTLLLLDSSWDFSFDYLSVFTNQANRHIRIFAVVYDMFPVQYPELFDSPAFVSVFKNWHNMILDKADDIICISKTTADMVEKYYNELHFNRSKPLKLHYFHMGADIPTQDSNARQKMRDFVDGDLPVFLMVGTIEPRKGHEVVLKALQKAIHDNKPFKLLLIGKNGWRNDSFLQTLARDKKCFDKYVLWIKDGKDAELHWAYQHTDALIAASKDEGFGLPIIEAAHFGLPVICSDIPIFHEVAGENATYFKALDSDALAEIIDIWTHEGKHPDSKLIKLYTWSECAQEILDILAGKIEPYKVLK